MHIAYIIWYNSYHTSSGWAVLEHVFILFNIIIELAHDYGLFINSNFIYCLFISYS